MTRSIFRSSPWIVITAVFLASVLSSFTGKHGGEGYEVFLDSKLLFQQFGAKSTAVKTVHLDKRWMHSQLSVAYYHCGQQGRNRMIIARDESGHILKQWKFTDATAASMTISPGAMSCSVKDILQLYSKQTGKIGLYYQSSELPAGRLLLNIVTDTK